MSIERIVLPRRSRAMPGMAYIPVPVHLWRIRLPPMRSPRAPSSSAWASAFGRRPVAPLHGMLLAPVGTAGSEAPLPNR